MNKFLFRRQIAQWVQSHISEKNTRGFWGLKKIVWSCIVDTVWKFRAVIFECLSKWIYEKKNAYENLENGYLGCNSQCYMEKARVKSFTMKRSSDAWSNVKWREKKKWNISCCHRTVPRVSLENGKLKMILSCCVEMWCKKVLVVTWWKKVASCHNSCESVMNQTYVLEKSIYCKKS